MSDMTPREAADALEDFAADADLPALRVLIDHARAAAPEGGDLAAWIGERIETARQRAAEAEARGWANLADVQEARRDAFREVRDRLPAPSVAAPPREDEPEDPFEPLSADIERMQTWMDALPSELESAALRSVLAAARRLEARRAAAPGAVRDPERAT